MYTSRRIGIGIFLVIMLLISIFGVMSFTASQKSRRTAGDLHPHNPITGNVLYTPILLDFESDGKIEIIVGSHDTIRCMHDPDGDGVWSLRWEEQIGSSIHNSPNIADLEGDGEVEVMIISESADSLFAVDNRGNTKWQYNYRSQAGYSDCHSSVASADLNFDGSLETIFSCQSSGKMLVIDDKGDDDVIGGGSINSGGWHSSPSIGELDGDDTSLEYIHQGAAGTIFAVKMGGASLWEKQIFPSTTTNPSPAIGDLDQDGRNEVIVVSEASNNLYCLDGATGNENWHFTMASGSMSSAALADLDVDELWEVIIGDTAGNLYCIDYEGKEVWSVNLGAAIKPSPAIADLDGDGLLEVVEVTNDGTCWAIDENGDIMWSYASGESIPTSSVTADPSPVIGDIDSDGYLEVLFATGSGTLRVLETEGQVPSSALPWPMFRYDREHTGFYNGTLEYGASITVDEDHTEDSIQSPLIHFIEPGETTEYNLSLTNVGHQSVIVGMFRDRYDLSVKNIPDNWTASLTAYEVPINNADTVHHDPHFENFDRVDEIKNIQLGESESMDFTLVVTAPKANVSFGDFAPIDAFAMSVTDNNATDSITTTTFLNLIVDLDVNIIADKDPFTEEKISTISADEDKMLLVELTNIGNLNDTYDLKIISGIDSGWTVSFSSNDPLVHEVKDLSLSASLFGLEGATMSLPLYIHCPMGAAKGKQVDVIIRGTSRVSEESHMETVVERDKVEMLVKETNLLTLEIMEPTKNVDPGETIAFTAVVTNRGNTRANVELTLMNPQMDDELPPDEKWRVYWEASTTNTHTALLRQHEPMPFRILLRAPANAGAETRIVMDVKAENLDDSSVVVFKQFTAIVNSKFDYLINFSKTTNSVLPGRDIKYELTLDEDDDGVFEKVQIHGKMEKYDFTIQNTGNAQDEIFLYVKDLPSVYWTGYFEEEDVSVSNIIIPIGEERQLTFVVLIPEDAVAGLFDLGMTSRGKGDDPNEGLLPENDLRYRVVKMTVLEIYDMMLISLDKKIGDDTKSISVDIDPGSNGAYTFKVTNHGNNEDHLKLTAGGFPANWDVWLASIANRRTASLTENTVYSDFEQGVDLTGISEPINYLYINRTPSAIIKLGIDESAWITIGFHIPVEQVAEILDVYINASSWDTYEGKVHEEVEEGDNQQTIIFRITNADLRIAAELTYLGGMEDGETYSVSTTIENIGDIHAEEVLVVFKVDGVEVDSTWVQLIGVGQAKLTYFTWVATEGEHDFTIEIDPYNDIIEKHDQNNGINNNVVSETVTVGETDLNVLGISGATWGIFALIVLAGVLVIVGIAAITKRIKK
ncbi:MAG: PQQ-binding-like beta-propeller repeat protein [Candidatus Thermoplasmatota archaeon]|jgi:uncharacterized repeat protein (TIGR01451 family)|nr:PQQ-binding-like beta-propeller repeat protein [Candidatus Thermoplasmatota archaeon]